MTALGLDDSIEAAQCPNYLGPSGRAVSYKAAHNIFCYIFWSFYTRAVQSVSSGSNKCHVQIVPKSCLAACTQ